MKEPTLFVANPTTTPVHFTWGGDAMSVEPGVSEWPEHVALHVVGKFPAYGLSFHPNRAAAEGTATE